MFQKHAPGAQDLLPEEDFKQHRAAGGMFQKHAPGARTCFQHGPASRRGLPTAQGSRRNVPEARTGSTDLLPEEDFLQHRAAGGMFQKQPPGALTCFQKRTSYSTGQWEECSRSKHREHGPASRRGLPTAQGSGRNVPEASTRSTDLLPEEDFLQHRAAGGMFQKHAARPQGLLPEEDFLQHRAAGGMFQKHAARPKGLLPEEDFLQHSAAGGLFQKHAPGAQDLLPE
ncbi:hypothetical protein NDU88_000329 [Pleurodeles waltl]|uniref:Uncharacterized protein n=1 Tax=Pleurodeles waltl TaxID=8319 RepID=A0AAV7R5P1_PLEWA|nr:hypothetical protein NDU88_000329 [Pleurodeles waltl]